MSARLAFLAALLALSPSVRADIVELPSGRQLFGIVTEKDGKVTIRAGNGSMMTFSRDQVVKITRESALVFHLREGKERLAAQDVLAARMHLQRALAADPGNSEVKKLLANVHVAFAQQDMEEYRVAAVVRSAKAALALDPGNEEAARLLAEAEKAVSGGAPPSEATLSDAAFLRAQAEAAGRVFIRTGRKGDLEHAEDLLRQTVGRFLSMRKTLERDLRALTPKTRDREGYVFPSEMSRQTWSSRRRMMRTVDAQIAWTEAIWARLHPPRTPSRDEHLRRSRSALAESIRDNPAESRTPRYLLAAAILAASAGDVPKAVAFFDAAVAALGKTKASEAAEMLRSVHFYRAESLLESGDAVAARRALSEVFRLGSDTDPVVREARILEAAALLEEGTALKRKGSKEADARLAAAAKIAAEFRKNGSPSEAARAAAVLERTEAVTAGKALPSAAEREQAAALLADQRYGAAIPILKKMLERKLSNSEREEILFNLGLCEMRGGKTSEGVSLLDRFAIEFPESARRSEACFLSLAGRLVLFAHEKSPAPSAFQALSARAIAFSKEFPNHALQGAAASGFLDLGPGRFGAAAVPGLLAVPASHPRRAEARLQAGMLLAGKARAIDPAAPPEEGAKARREASEILEEGLAGAADVPLPKDLVDEAWLQAAALRIEAGDREQAKLCLQGASSRAFDPARRSRFFAFSFEAALLGSPPDVEAARKILEGMPADRAKWPPGVTALFLGSLRGALDREPSREARALLEALQQDLVRMRIAGLLEGSDAGYDDLAGIAEWAAGGGDLELAAKAWKRLLERFAADPERRFEIPAARARYAACLSDLDRLDEAQKVLSEILQDNPGPQVALSRARLLVRLNRTAEAWKILDGLEGKLAQGSPLWFTRRAVQIRCRIQDKDMDGAMKALRLTAQFYPSLGGGAARAEFLAIAKDLAKALPPARAKEGETLLEQLSKPPLAPPEPKPTDPKVPDAKASAPKPPDAKAAPAPVPAPPAGTNKN
mgnify:CR=1 FL=1